MPHKCNVAYNGILNSDPDSAGRHCQRCWSLRRALHSFLFLVFLQLSCPPVAAQDNSANDYSEWNSLATQAEKLSTDATATDKQLTEIRARLSDWRSEFKAGQDANAERIAAVREQIAALGPVPAEGETEPEDIAARRAELNKRLQTLIAPRLKAIEAFSRANNIIDRIDDAMAERVMDVLVYRLPSPFLPSNWRQAASDGMKLLQGIGAELDARIGEPGLWMKLGPHISGAIGYLAAAVLLLTLGRRWVDSLPSRLSLRTPNYARAFVVFTVSILQIAVPILGIFLLVEAVTVSHLPGEWTAPFWDAVPVAGIILFGGAWLSRLLFPLNVIVCEILSIDEDKRRVARRVFKSLVILFAIHHLLASAVLPYSGLYENSVDQANRVPLRFSEGSISVWHYVLIVIPAMLMFRLGAIFNRLRTDDLEMPPLYRHNILNLVGFISRVVAVFAVVCGALGQINLANALIWPWFLTMALIGLLIMLLDMAAETVNVLKRDQEGARDGLAPLVIGLVLMMLSVPVFLMIWGASFANLEGYWNRFQQGVKVAGLTISPVSILTFAIVFGIGFIATHAMQGVFRNAVLPRTRLDKGGQNAVVAGLGYVGIILATILAFTSAGIDLSSLAILAGALSVGIGFGLQNIVSNFVSGIILLIERPISIGDWIEAGGRQGIVTRISVRSTQIETFDKTEVIVPNSDLISLPVVNWTRHNQHGRIIVPVGVAYGTDTRRVAAVLQEIIEDQPMVTINPAPYVLFRGFGADSLNFEIRAILSDVGSGIRISSEVCHQIAERFAAEGIEIPFAQRDIWLRNPEVLAGHVGRTGHEVT